MADVELSGLDPGAHHAMNVALHAANTLLLFLVLVRLTGTAGPSAFAAALFALHPLHVESVAWIAERKDVLSTFFWLLAMLAYARYTAARSARVKLVATYDRKDLLSKREEILTAFGITVATPEEILTLLRLR